MLNINIEIKKAKFLFSENSAFVSFPYDVKVIDVIKSLHKRRYIYEEKSWEIPINDIEKLQKMLPDENIFVKETSTKVNIPKSYKFKLIPYEFQKEGIEFGLNNSKFILGDTQGIGKTMESLHIAAIKKELFLHKHCLIICCINGLKVNWQREIEQHTYFSGYILGTRFKRNGDRKPNITSTDKREDLENISAFNEFFLITNSESFRDKEFSDKIQELIAIGEISTVIVDEMHKVKNPNTIVAEGLFKIKNVSNLILLSGTLFVNSPLDLYIPMTLIGIESSNYWHYKSHYCIFKEFYKNKKKIKVTIGYKNLGELQLKLKNYMVKRDKEDVLNLPNKIFYTEYLEMDEKQQKLYNEVKNGITTKLNIELSDNPLALLTRLRQITGAPILISNINNNVKIERMIEIIDENILKGQKVIVFSLWSSVVDLAAKELSKNGVDNAIITMSTKDKMKAIDRFRLNDDCKVILGTIASLGTGYSLPEANTIIFLDSPFTDSDRQQAIDRAHRMTTNHSITIINLVCANTVDERVEKIVSNKVEMAGLIINGKITSRGLTYLLN